MCVNEVYSEVCDGVCEGGGGQRGVVKWAWPKVDALRHDDHTGN